jgi:3-oxoacyl-[acyl-carrier-protein] synthase-3
MSLVKMDKNNKGVGVLGAGRYVPKKVITNQMLEEWTGVSSAKIIERIGVETRYIVEDHETASGMSASAAQQAMSMAGIKPSQIDLIIVCSFTGDYVFPAMACKVQELIKATNAAAFDLMANCTGFQVGVCVASDRMKCDQSIKYALVIGTALQSRYIDWSDPDSALYFGDGAGAVILGPVPSGYGVLASEISSNGKVFEAVRMRGGGSSFPMRPENVNDGLQYYELNGLEVWKQVVQYQPLAIERSLAKINKKTIDVDFFIFHQANLRLIEYLMGKMKQPMSKTFTNVENIGNTADASMAIALCDAMQAGCIKRDQLVVISGVGAGFIFGSTVILWH